jgi:hypothetical protein
LSGQRRRGPPTPADRPGWGFLASAEATPHEGAVLWWTRACLGRGLRKMPVIRGGLGSCTRHSGACACHAGHRDCQGAGSGRNSHSFRGLTWRRGPPSRGRGRITVHVMDCHSKAVSFKNVVTTARQSRVWYIGKSVCACLGRETLSSIGQKVPRAGDRPPARQRPADGATLLLGSGPAPDWERGRIPSHQPSSDNTVFGV